MARTAVVAEAAPARAAGRPGPDSGSGPRPLRQVRAAPVGPRVIGGRAPGSTTHWPGDRHRPRRKGPLIVRVQSLTLAAASVALLAPAAFPAAADADRPDPARPDPGPVVRDAGEVRDAGGAGDESEVRDAGGVRAADLLARVEECDQISKGRYRTDAGAPETVPVCGTEEAVFWKADLDIDCDGRPGPLCNRRTDPYFSDTTAFTQSDGRYLDAERLPYIVVPVPSRRWDHGAHGVRGGSVAAVVYEDRVRYAVVGDRGPHDIIGEASYAAAAALGIRPDPRGGGTDSGVTYIVFKDSRVSPIEDIAAAVATGERLARKFIAAADGP
ncbi:glycoside hydrolase family 75 protein [Streptomyces sp. B93]|nr:glycoside hydrolase family 75 protein [Streptomyces sp. B93]